MRRVLLILLIACTYAGCAREARPVPSAIPERVEGGTLRWLDGPDAETESVFAAAATQPILAAATDVPAMTASPFGECRRLRLTPGTGAPGVPATGAAGIVAAWEAALREPGSAHGWLLEPITGVAEVMAGASLHAAGLLADGSDLQLCAERPVPDLDERLRHPSLRVAPGPFRADPDGGLLRDPSFPGRRPTLDGTSRIPGGDPDLLFDLDEADATVVRGRAANLLLPERNLRLERIERWDRTYALWCEPTARWVNDPSFRRWLAASIDRPKIVDQLFEGRATPVRDLGLGDAPGAPSGGRPLGPTSEPRLRLYYDTNDPHAVRLSARLKAEMLPLRIRLELVPLSTAALSRALREGRADLALVVHEPASEDPILALAETFHRLGPGAESARRMLAQASGLADPAARRAAAAAAEETLTGEGLLAPLVRVEAWLVTGPRVRHLEAGPRGVVDFAGAEVAP